MQSDSQYPKKSRSGIYVARYLAPALTILILFNGIPLLGGLFLSFASYNPIIDLNLRFVGFENYFHLLFNAHSFFWPAIFKTLIFIVLAVGLQTGLGFVLAMLLRRPFKGRGYLTAAMLIPMMLSPAVFASFWRYMLNPEYGIVNWLLDVRWSYDGNHPLAFLAVVFAEVWIWTPFMALISLAALSGIPQVLYESAQVDRASKWFRFIHITMPLAAPLVGLGVLFRVIDSIKVFDTAMVLNGNFPEQPTTFISVLLHSKAFSGSHSLGESFALSYLMLALALALAYASYGLMSKISDRKL